MQLNAFDDQRETDEELNNHGPPGIDLSSHVEVFYAILGQVSELERLASLFFFSPAENETSGEEIILFTSISGKISCVIRNKIISFRMKKKRNRNY